MTNNFISFEEAEKLTGINQYTLGRVKSGYLLEFISNKQFNINLYQKKVEEFQKLRHLGHCVYYAISDYIRDDEELSVYLSKLCGRKREAWYEFLEIGLFTLEKNDILMNWFEKKMITTVYEDVKRLSENGDIILEDYIY